MTITKSQKNDPIWTEHEVIGQSYNIIDALQLDHNTECKWKALNVKPTT